MKRSILVFPCGSEVGLEIHKSLSFSTHFELIGASSVDDHGKFVYQRYIGDIPFVTAPKFIEEINKVVEANNIEFIFPARDDVALTLAIAFDEGKLGCKVLTSRAEVCRIARSKKKTYEALKDVILVPKIYSSAQEVTPALFPVFLKPEVGEGSKGTVLAGHVEDINFYQEKNSALLILEYLPGKEYTVDCFTDRHGRLLFCEGRERARIANGISVNSSMVEDERFADLANRINSVVRFTGVWFFQVKENAAGELVLLEIAPRIAGAMGLVRAKGVNLALLTLFDALEYDIHIFENNYAITIDRSLQNSYTHNIHYKHVYLDFDDLVIFEGKVNPSVMAFVYQCINKKIKIHLLTKHKQDLHQTLQNYRLSSTFDEILWIQDERQKSDLIKEKDAIFIDDSFAERKQVHERCGIPVFDAHMIEALMEKF